PKESWKWEDGQALELSSTQQHWLIHQEDLFLVYTRKTPENLNVIRWRAPLWMSRFNAENQRLIRDSEQVVLPMIGNGIEEPDEVALMGNFHVTTVSDQESWITVGEWLPRREARGDLLLARIHWPTD
ncbi:MAG: exo-alpha-sialidase, partial [Limisphaerales bacterium]